MKLDDSCNNCLDVVTGSNKIKGTEFYKINSDIFCSLECFYEDYNKEKDIKISNSTQANKNDKSKNKVYKKRKQQKKRKNK